MEYFLHFLLLEWPEIPLGHICKVYAFSLSLRKVMYPGQDHSEDFSTQSEVFCHLSWHSTALTLAFTSDATHFHHEQICNFWYVYTSL